MNSLSERRATANATDALQGNGLETAVDEKGTKNSTLSVIKSGLNMFVL